MFIKKGGLKKIVQALSELAAVAAKYVFTPLINTFSAREAINASLNAPCAP